jgi:hypothetical protein
MSNYNKAAYEPYKHMSKLMIKAPNREFVPPDPTQVAPGERKLNAYEALVNLVLDHKMELKKIPLLGSAATAQKYLDDHHMASKYRLDTTNDLNGDNVPDVVVWNRRTQQPYTINGYRLKKSDWGARNMYYNENDTPEKRDGKSYSEWLNNNEFWDTTINKSNPYRRSIEPKGKAINYIKAGWRIPKRPQKSIKPYTIFCRIVKPILEAKESSGKPYKAFLVETVAKQLAAKHGLKFDYGSDCYTVFNRIVSPILLYRVLYMQLVLRLYFFTLGKSYPEFKYHLKNYPERLETWFTETYLKNTNGIPDLDANNEFISNGRLNFNKLFGQLVDGDLDIDGSDINDAIIFLMGPDNTRKGSQINFGNNVIENNPFPILITNAPAAAEFLFGLKSKDKNTSKKAKKLLRILKDNANAGFKYLTGSQGLSLFYNTTGKAADNFRILVANGLDPSNNTVETAITDAQENGVKQLPKIQSPVKGANEEEKKQFIADVLTDGNWYDEDHLLWYINASGEANRDAFDKDKFSAMITRLINNGGIAAFDMNEYNNALRENGTKLDFHNEEDDNDWLPNEEDTNE